MLLLMMRSHGVLTALWKWRDYKNSACRHVNRENKRCDFLEISKKKSALESVKDMLHVSDVIVYTHTHLPCGSFYLNITSRLS